MDLFVPHVKLLVQKFCQVSNTGLLLIFRLCYLLPVELIKSAHVLCSLSLSLAPVLQLSLKFASFCSHFIVSKKPVTFFFTIMTHAALIMVVASQGFNEDFSYPIPFCSARRNMYWGCIA